MIDVRIEVQAKQRGSSFCPVSADVPLPAKKVEGLALLDKAAAVAVPFQVHEKGDACIIHWLVDSIAVGQKRIYALTDAVSPAKVTGVELQEKEGDRLQIRIGGELFTNYHYGKQLARPVLYPIIGPFGQGVTRSYPMEIVENDHVDHPHHRSVWVAWGSVNGSDNWSEEKGHGNVVHQQFESWGTGPIFGWISSRNDWVDAKGKKLMQDRMAVRIYNVPSSMRILDLDVTLEATEGDVRFGDTKEGGICSIRVAASMEADRGGKIENSFGGVNEQETWGKRASWCDYSGIVGGHRVGIAAFDHPSNFRYPTYWHVRNYGLMTANPFGLSHFLAPAKVDGSHLLSAGGSLQFRYRIHVHAGDAVEGGVRGKYLDWIYPPVAKVSAGA